MCDSDCYDCIVVGAGVMGMATAWYLTQKLHKRTLVLEQWPWMHERGSSAGHSRIFRRTYDDPAYTSMVVASKTFWNELETQGNRKILHQCGIVVSGADVHLNTLANVMNKTGQEYQRLSAGQLQQKFPQFGYFGENENFIFDSYAAMIAVREAMETFQKIIADNGGEICTRQKVTSIESTDEGALVRTTQKNFRCKTVIVTVGPWTSDFFRELAIPLKVKKVVVCYFKTKAEDGAFAPDHHPCKTRYFDEKDAANLIYSIPEFEYPGYVKFGHHLSVDTHPNNQDRTAFDEKLLSQIKDYVTSYYPWLENEPHIIEYSMYTLTPDENFVIDRHPKMKNVIIGAGFSGHGFKMAPVIGQMLSELAFDLPPSFDNSLFLLNRFSIKPKL